MQYLIDRAELIQLFFQHVKVGIELEFNEVYPSQFLPALCAKHTAGGPNSDFKGINQNL